MAGASVGDGELTAIEAAVQSSEERYLADLARLVNTDCGSYTPAGVDQVGAFVAGFMTDLGAKVERRPDPAGRLGATVIGTGGGDRRTRGGPRVLLIGP